MRRPGVGCGIPRSVAERDSGSPRKTVQIGGSLVAARSVLTTLSRLVFPDLRPVIVVVTTTGFLLSLGFAQRATHELIQALRNPPGPQPPLPTSVAVWIIFDRIVELLKRARERLRKWMQLLRFTVSTMASYS